MVEYSKPHLPYDQQLKLLTSRGMTYSDRGAAVRALKRVGYYRLSPYTCTLREPLPVDERRPSGTRSDRYLEGRLSKESSSSTTLTANSACVCSHA